LSGSARFFNFGAIRALEERKERHQGYEEELKQSGESRKSLTDGDSRLNGKMDVCYNVQTAIDGKHKLIAMEAGEDLEADRLRVVTDRGYDSVQDVVADMGAGMDIHVAGRDYDICVPAEEGGAVIREHKEGRCVYNGERNIVLCPMGEVLYPAIYKKREEGGREYMSTGKPVGTVSVGVRRKAAGGGMRFPFPNRRLARYIMTKDCR
jgi:hypothetical protein